MLGGKPIDQAGTIGIGDGQRLSRLARVHQCLRAERPHAFRGSQIRAHRRGIIK